jgi:HD-GYP domain-containing protein (c-di-GMP phosphodiesterase class II)
MTVHAGLAQRVAALRQRLEEVTVNATPAAPPEPNPRVRQLHQITQQVAYLQGGMEPLANHIRELLPHPPESLDAASPRQLSWRTRRLLLHGRELLDQLKSMAAQVSQGPGGEDRLSVLYHETLAMTEFALRSVQAFPESATEQARLSMGLETNLRSIGERVTLLKRVLDRRRVDEERTTLLAHLFEALIQGRPALARPVQDLAETLCREIEETSPLHWLSPGDTPERAAAVHCLNCAQVMARLARHDPEWRGRQADAVLAALVHDAGMAAAPPEILTQATPLSDDQRRQVEAHVGLSADAARRLFPNEGWLMHAVRAHHERLDGAGYPAGAQGHQIPRLARLLAVCDVYAALLSRRPHREALAPRSALTETLLEAEKGRLDTRAAELLLALSFYPVGTVVELSDGQVGLVIATNRDNEALAAPARPLVQLLLDSSGQPVLLPEFLHLGQTEGRHIVRSLTRDEARNVLGVRHWNLL